MTVRKALRWALVGTVALSAVSMLRISQPGLVGASPVIVEPIGREPRDREPPGSTLPALIEREPIGLAENDPFAGPRRPLQVEPPPATSVRPFVGPMPAPPPPPMLHRFFGSMRTPEGTTIVYITDGSDQVVAKPDQVLQSGYVIEAVTDHEIKVVYPSLGYHTVVSIPPESNP